VWPLVPAELGRLFGMAWPPSLIWLVGQNELCTRGRARPRLVWAICGAACINQILSVDFESLRAFGDTSFHGTDASRSKMFVLVDGYNLLHAAGMAQSVYRPGDLLRCRTRLLKFLLAKLSAAEIKAATIVFDARDPPPDRPAQVVVSGLKVLFANPGGDADVLIQEWLSRHPTPRRVTLVSSDRELQRAARGCGSKFIGSGDFFHDLERRRSSAGRRTGSTPGGDTEEKPAAHLTASQTAYWLKVFGDVPLVDSEPVADLPVPAPAAAASNPTPVSPVTRKARRAQRQPLRDNSKPAGIADEEELAYWMNVFGELPADSASRSADELRVADLESWLKRYEPNEGVDGGQRQ